MGDTLELFEALGDEVHRRGDVTTILFKTPKNRLEQAAPAQKEPPTRVGTPPEQPEEQGQPEYDDPPPASEPTKPSVEAAQAQEPPALILEPAEPVAPPAVEESVSPPPIPDDPDQLTLLDVPPDWKGKWTGMPEFEQRDLTPWASLPVHFASRADRVAFSKLIGQTITDDTRSLWFPKAEIGRYVDKRYATAEKVDPRYPIYVISKGRWESRLTVKALEKIGVPHNVVIEPQEREAYADGREGSQRFSLNRNNEPPKNMIAQFQTDSDFRDTSVIAQLLDMIERRAPLLMRTGGGGLNVERLEAGKAITPDVVARMNRMAKQGKSIHEIAEKTGYAPCTCGRLTREVRGVKPRIFR